MCFVDLEKPYNCVPQHKLKELLKKYGVPRLLLHGISSHYECTKIAPTSLPPNWGCLVWPLASVKGASCDLHKQDIKAQAELEGCLAKVARRNIPAVFREYCAFGLIWPALPVHSWAVQCGVWSGRNENQRLPIWGHWTPSRNSGLLLSGEGGASALSEED